MNKYKKLLALLTIAVLLIGIFAGCTTTQRKPVPNYGNNYPNTRNNSVTNNRSMAPGGSGGNAISATFEMVDFTYATVIGSSVNVRAGAGTFYPAIGKIYAGQKIRVVGKLDGWYVIKIPTSNRLGAVAKQYLKAYTTTNTTATPKPVPQTPTGTAAGTVAMSADESRILQLCNAERAKVGAPALKGNGQLTNIARLKSQDMVNKNYFSHQSPTYGSPFDMMKNNGITYMYAGENLAMNQSADAAFKAWMNSEGHRKNILNPNFTELGVGIAPKGGGTYLYTQEFIGR